MYVFVSDVHLSRPTDRRYIQFKNWLLSLKKRHDIKKVFLMGDVFDLWLGDRKHFVKKYQDVVDIICELAAIKEVHLFEGNHDFQFGFFWKKNGVITHRSFFEFADEKGKWLLTHGDLIDPSDRKYLWLRWFFRSWFCKFLIKILPGKALAAIGNSINRTESKVDGRTVTDFKSKWRSLTRGLFKKRSFDFFVCGHYHVRLQERNDDFIAVNLGSWLGKELKYLEYSELKGFEFRGDAYGV